MKQISVCNLEKFYDNDDNFLMNRKVTIEH